MNWEFTENYARSQSRLNGISWDEVVSAPDKSIAAGMMILDSKQGDLGKYLGKESSDSNNAYKNSINKMSNQVIRFLQQKGKSRVGDLNNQECRELIFMLKK